MRKTLNDRECLICHTTVNLERHHVLFGNDRPLAEKYGYCVWLCHNHHNEPPYGVHFNRKIDLVVKQWAKDWWIKKYGADDWEEKFGGVKNGHREDLLLD